MKRTVLYLWASVVTALMVGIAYYIGLRANQPQEILLAVINLTLSCITFVLSVAGALFFVKGLSKFKTSLRYAYILLCIGVAAYGLAQSQVAILALTNAWWWAVNGYIMVPYLVAVFLVFLGIRRFAHIMHIHTRWAGLAWVLITAIALGAGAFLLPYAPKEDEPLVVALTTALSIICMVFFSFSGIVAWKIRKTIGPTYVLAMQRLAVTLGTMAFAFFHFVLVQVFVPLDSWYYKGEMTSLPLLVSGIFILSAGYAVATFGRMPETSPSIGAGTDGTLRTEQMISVITYAAGLASRPQELDNILDDLRMFTSSKISTPQPQQGAKVSERDTKILSGIYARIENYLISEEPLRIFTSDGLHKEIITNLHLSDSAAAKIWQTNTPTSQ